MSEFIARGLVLFGQLCIAIAVAGPLMDGEMSYTTSLWMLPIGITAIVGANELIKRDDRRKKARGEQ